eukprot:1633462-Prymnesium_polylepis.1
MSDQQQEREADAGGGAARRPVSRPASTSMVKTGAGASTPINAYHFCMLADTVRNVAYRRAIEAALDGRRGSRVIDIGAGTGLLSLIAVRAGAGSVDCVEMNPVLAATAQVTLASSRRASERSVPVTVWNCISTDLRVDSGGRTGPTAAADLVVSEVLDSGLIGEGCLHSMRDAARRLLAPGGVMIPAAATVYVMLVQVSTPEQPDGTALGALDALREGYAPVRLHTVSHVKLSSAAAAMRFDFARLADSLGGEVTLRLNAVRRGACNAVAWWFDLHLDEHSTLSCAPGATVRTWKQNLFYLGAPLAVERGTEVEVLVRNQGDDNIHVYAGAVGFTRGWPKDDLSKSNIPTTLD